MTQSPEPGVPRVLVCQHGARRRYAVARMLERATTYTEDAWKKRLVAAIRDGVA